jgi:EPS-associated MarR family transcriptional regulator
MPAAVSSNLLDSSAQQPQIWPKEMLPLSTTGSDVHLRLLSLIEQNPTWTQRQLADALGVSLGKTNYCLRALKEKGLVKWGNFSQNPNRLKYVHHLTPKGIAQKLRLTAHFLQRKEHEFEELKREIARLRTELGEKNPGSDAELTAAPSGEPLVCSRALRCNKSNE